MKAKTYRASAPSNIAFLKYWGKSDPHSQWPTNDSVSMTLSECKTITSATPVDAPQHEIHWRGRTLPGDDPRTRKILAHLGRLAMVSQSETKLRIKTENSFPDACGIASSASGFAALTIAATAAFCDAESFAELAQAGFSVERLASEARLGSGSACRSLHGGYVQWLRGKAPTEQSVINLAAAGHWDLADIIAVCSDAEKPVSSSEAHGRVHSSPFFAVRLAGLPKKEAELVEALAARDLARLGPLLEDEALSIHGVIGTADEPVRYLTQTGGELLAFLRHFRQDSGICAYFTLDAGPNVHIICERNESAVVAEAVGRAFPDLPLIRDGVGSGPTLTIEDEPN